MAKRECRAPECHTTAYCRGLCKKHYQRQIRHGDLTITHRIIGDDEYRFLSKIRLEGECWIWSGASRDHKGYGEFYAAGKLYRAHRWAYEHWIGPIPEGQVIDHLCDTPSCVRPEHLQAISNGLNLIIGMIKDLGQQERRYLRELLR